MRFDQETKSNFVYHPVYSFTLLHDVRNMRILRLTLSISLAVCLADIKPMSAESGFRQADTTPPIVSVPTPPPDATVTGKVPITAKFSDAGSGVNLSSAKVLLDDRDVTGQTRLRADGVTLDSERPLAKGIHRVEIRVSDKAGNQSNRLIWRFGVETPVSVEAGFDQRVFLVNGEPYFPLGIYNFNCAPTNPDKSILAQAAAAGINFQILSESTSLEDLDVMLQHGMKALKDVHAALAAVTDQDKGPLVSIATATKDHAAMLGWWSSDPETMEPQRKNMALGYQILKENDPRHPVIWVLSHADQYKESIRSSDVLFCYLYPILQPGMTVSSIDDRVLQPAFAAADPVGRQVWFASQGIDLGIAEGNKLDSPADFRPTPAEMRAMNYLALAKGVKGLLFYAQGGTPNPDVVNDLREYPAQWQQAMKIASEVRYLAPALAAGKPVHTAQLEVDTTRTVWPGYEPVNYSVPFREWKHEGVHYLIAVNVTDRPIRVWVKWRFPKPVQPKVLFEDREMSEPSSEMNDTFRPFEVHVYQWK